MGALLRLEVRRAFGNRCFVMAITVATLLAAAATIEPIQRYLVAFLPHQTDPVYIAERYTQQFAVNAYTSWVPMNMYHAIPNLMFFVLPLLIAFAYGWSLRADVASGYAQCVMVRTTRTRYYLAKACAAFLAGGTVVALPLVVNFLIVICFVPIQMPSTLDDMYTGIFQEVTFSGLFYTNPPLYMLARIGIDFGLGGLWAVAVLGLSLLMRNRVAVVVVPFIAAVVIKSVMDGVYDLMGEASDCWTILDHLMAAGNSGYYTGWMLLADAAVLLAIGVAVPFVIRKRDAL